MMKREFEQILANRAAAAGLALPVELSEALSLYFEMLARWNRRINLVGFHLETPSVEAVDRLFIEPLLVAASLATRPKSLLDIGSGGGSPAIPLALAVNPAKTVLVESRQRKATFLSEVLRRLEMAERAEVLCERFDTVAKEPRYRHGFSLITVRAVKMTARAFEGVSDLLGHGGTVVHFSGMALPAQRGFYGVEPIDPRLVRAGIRFLTRDTARASVPRETSPQTSLDS